MAPGSSDLMALGPNTLKQMAASAHLPLISATWLTPSGDPIFPPWMILQKGELKMAVIGLSDEPTEDLWRTELSYEDPVLATSRAIEEITPPPDLIVALSNLPDEDNDRLAAQVSGLAAILTTRGAAYDEPRRVGDNLIIEVPNRGRYVSVVHIRLASDAGRTLDLERAERLSFRQRDHLQRQVVSLERDRAAHPEQLVQSQTRLSEMDLLLKEQARGYNLAYVDVIPLGTRYDGDTGTREIIQRYKNKILQQAVAKLHSDTRLPDGPPRYVGSGLCVSCHASQFARWALTSHARAWETLVMRDANTDPECVTCHATGFALPGGWAETNTANVRKFKSVQCESCHGAAEAHIEDPRAPLAPVIPATCLSCHDRANSPHFDYQTYLPMASCSPSDSAPPPEPQATDSDKPAQD